jgi:Cd(II)/Pb(II)-responsive transcriptional regulator
MKIGELAKAAGCQTVTVRFYERKGLLGAASRSDSNYRVYGMQDLERLMFIRNCRSLGLTLREIERLVAIHDDPTVQCDDVNACLDKHLDEVDRQMEALKRLKKELKQLRRRCMVPGASSTCGVLSALVSEPIDSLASNAESGSHQTVREQRHGCDQKTAWCAR